MTSIGYSYLLPEKIAGFDETCDYMWELPTLQLAGGMTVSGLDSGRDNGDARVRGSWDFPVELSKVESIQFGEVVVPLKQEKK